MPVNETLTLEQLSELREKTETISQFFYTNLLDYLGTLRSLLAPDRLLGKYAGTKESTGGEDRVFAQLQEQYRAVSGKPFELSPELDTEPLSLVENQLQLYPSEYIYETQEAGETKAITLTSPVRWVLAYRSEYTLSQVRLAVSGKAERRIRELRQFLVNALVMQAVLDKQQGVTNILTDLRYTVNIEHAPDLGALPLVTIETCLPSFRPPDELILSATRFSGIPAFIELIDLETIQTLQDPLRLSLEEMLG